MLVKVVSVICFVIAVVQGKYQSGRRLDKNAPPLPAEKHGIYHHKMYGSHNGTIYKHKKAWMALETVNGLKNEDLVVMVISTATQKFQYIRERCVCVTSYP